MARKNNKTEIEKRTWSKQKVRPTTDSRNVAFSFEDLDKTQNPPGFSYDMLQAENKLIPVLNRIETVCTFTIEEAIKQGLLEVYDTYPPKSKFKCPPKHVAKELGWGTVQSVINRKGRIAGFLKGNVFHIVFFDLNHKFWPTEI